ncbi:Sensor histidine kinase graS [Alloiococcus otitis]|uniref:histidine kinase n=1 Tax=Alloiococcus otitis ATCC 51267 TaxID=883081 RepID=K9EAN1_9LACT|nr:sensor histidine kinase [Alloiococcus otitis]EKU94294.1 hypothetical protein HMPREF9698_00326 [Alloiococcus otitis ATCC 51267]SUU81072.1 Sensor histidine kinase graS [Alloiococcus otitis]
MGSFLKRESLSLSILTLSILVFGLVYWLLNLPIYGFLLATSLIIFLSLVLFGVKYSQYQKEEKLKKAYQELDQAYKQLKNIQSQDYQKLEDYFILWIHQIKTPLTAAKLLARDQKLRELDPLLLKIENYSQLAMSFLKLNKPETDLNIACVSLDDLMKPLLRKYSSQFIQTKTKLIYQPILKKVITDANWSQLMIEQVLNNALKYAAGTSVHIYFEDKSLFIEDRGVGISEVDLPKIFDKGYSGFNGKLNQKSTGLGLFIVQSISRRLNHPIQVESNIGQGSRFQIEFPDQPQANF